MHPTPPPSNQTSWLRPAGEALQSGGIVNQFVFAVASVENLSNSNILKIFPRNSSAYKKSLKTAKCGEYSKYFIESKNP